LVYEEKYENHQHARIRELELIKQKSGRQFFKMPGLPIQRFRPSVLTRRSLVQIQPPQPVIMRDTPGLAQIEQALFFGLTAKSMFNAKSLVFP